MSLPTAFKNPEDYFEESILFFKEYQRLYNCANTDILVEDVLDVIKMEELEKFNVFEKNFDLPTEAKRDRFLKNFFIKLERLKTVYEDFKGDECLEDVEDVPLSPKKRHEIIYLSKEIGIICEENNCDIVVDFGSGLGYLDQFIFKTTKYKVLGLECNDSHYIGAKKRQNKYHAESTDHVKYIKHTINDNSHTNIKVYLKEKFKNHSAFCITGLHACADLTIDAINIFLKMEDARTFVLMPCCYHKMSVCEETFKNFPLSDCLKDIFEKYKGFEFMKVPFLRLAAQPQYNCSDLDGMTFNLLARAALQQYANNRNCKIKRKKRKAVKLKAMDKDFDAYVQDASTNGFTMISKNEPYAKSNIVEFKNGIDKSIDFDIEELKLIWRQISQNLTYKKAAIFILLQNYLQPVIENFILYDRLIYLKENGVENSKYKKILNDKVSPRCLALVANKMNTAI